MIPFRARHVKEIRPDADEELLRMAWIGQETGPAYTAFLLGRAIGAAGVSIQKPGKGEAWAIFSDTIAAFPFFLHRRIKREIVRIFERENLTAIYALCRGDSRETKWLKALGFKEAEPDKDMTRTVPEGIQLYGMDRGIIL